MMDLQNCVNLVEAVPYSHTEICCGGNQVIDIKVDDVTEVQEEKYILRELLPVIKAEEEICLCIHC
jgi:hypothetical protein